MLIVEQSTLQNWWHNHRWGFRLLVNACHWTRIKNPHVGVNWPRRVSQELRVPHPGGRRSHSAGLDLPQPLPSHLKKMPEQQNVPKLFGREQEHGWRTTEAAWRYFTKEHKKHIWKWSASPMATRPRLQFQNFLPHPVDYINCVSASMKESEIR